LQEGVSAEAGSLAGHLGLGKLIVLYDDNHITIDGHTDLSFSEDVTKRYEAYGWHTSIVKDGDHDIKAIEEAIEAAKKVTDKPSLIKVRLTIGFGSSFAESHKVHGSPLGPEEVAKVKTKFGLDPNQQFFVPPQVAEFYRSFREKGKAQEEKWNALFAEYQKQFPELAAEFNRRHDGKLPTDWKKVLPTFKPTDPEKATRQHSQTVINALAKVIPDLVGGSADLNPSTLSYLDCSKDFQKNSHEGRNIRFGVREHAMAAVCNGLAAYGGFVPYCATFMNFIGYAMGAVRLSAISEFGVIYVMTHDSIGLGEDGPTHQPINSLMMLRAMPNIFVLRPADGNETSGAYAVAIEHRHTPSVLALSRQGLPNLKGTSIEGVAKGAYVIQEPEDGKAQIIFVSSGSEVSIAVKAAELAKDLKVRIVSMPSWELFRAQPLEYQLSVFPDGIPVLAVEAGSVVGWREYAHAVIGMSTFGASGPYKEVYAKFGITSENVVKQAHGVLEFYKGKQVLSPVDRPLYPFPMHGPGHQ
jgi:transketolase